jgi:5-methylcytosine-specific restriction protein A
MSTQLRRQCAAPGCPKKAVHSGRCREHGWSWPGTPMPAGWTNLRAQVLREEPTCRVPGCGRPSAEVDHITARRHGGGDERSNLRGMCSEHHRQKTQADSTEGQRRKRARR